MCWLYLGDRDVIHITQGGAKVSRERKTYLGQQSQATQGSGAIDHVAFRCTDLADMLEHFKAQAVDHQTRQVDNQGLFQVFLTDPNGIKIELNFATAEAKHIQAAVLASAL